MIERFRTRACTDAGGGCEPAPYVTPGQAPAVTGRGTSGAGTAACPACHASPAWTVPTPVAPTTPPFDLSRGLTAGQRACADSTPLTYAGYCMTPGIGEGPPGSVGVVLAFYQGICDATLCGLADMAMHPGDAAVGLLVTAANGLAPGLVEVVAPDYSTRAQATRFAEQLRSADPNESARTQGQLFGMVAALLLPLKGLRGARAVEGLPDGTIIVRGGTKNPIPPPGEVFSGAQGATLREAAAGVPNGGFRWTTAGEIRGGGGTVKPNPQFNDNVGRINYQHVDICLGRGGSLWRTQVDPIVPPGQRFGGAVYPYDLIAGWMNGPWER